MNRTLCILCLLLLNGCAGVGILVSKTVGPPAVPPKYTLKKVPTLIFVENYRNGTSLQFESEALTRAVEAEFENQQLVPLVESDRIYLLRDNDPRAFHAMKIPAVGRACGADQVVYVDLVDFAVGIEQMRNDAQGVGMARVRVVDTKTGNTVWPEDAAEGHPVSYSLKLDSADQPVQTLRAKVVKGTADRITRLFYSYKPDEVPD